MSQAQIDRIRALVRDIPDFPRAGVGFKDITPILADPDAFTSVIELMAVPFEDARVDVVFGVESRGFLLGAPLALELGAAFVPVRKPGKLPSHVVREDYELEYGHDALEVHVDAAAAGANILLCDDVLATGGTAAATVRLIERLGARCLGATFLMELGFLNGAAKLGDLPRHSLLTY